MINVLVGFLVSVPLWLAAGFWFATVRPWRTAVRRRVIVVTTQDKTISGILWERRGPLLTIREPVVLEQGRQTAADGEMILERSQIQWVQVISS